MFYNKCYFLLRSFLYVSSMGSHLLMASNISYLVSKQMCMFCYHTELQVSFSFCNKLQSNSFLVKMDMKKKGSPHTVGAEYGEGQVSDIVDNVLSMHFFNCLCSFSYFTDENPFAINNENAYNVHYPTRVKVA